MELNHAGDRKSCKASSRIASLKKDGALIQQFLLVFGRSPGNGCL